MVERPRLSGKFSCAPEFISASAYKFLYGRKKKLLESLCRFKWASETRSCVVRRFLASLNSVLCLASLSGLDLKECERIKLFLYSVPARGLPLPSLTPCLAESHAG